MPTLSGFKGDDYSFESPTHSPWLREWIVNVPDTPDPHSDPENYRDFDPESLFRLEEHQTLLDEKTFVLVSLPEQTGDEQGSAGVPLDQLLEGGAIVTVVLSVMSLGLWITQDIPLLHPVLALLSLVGAPFIYLMGRAARSPAS